MRRALLLGLVLVALAGSGCSTAVGNYFGNRARDFGQCFRLEVGAGFGAGGGVRALGVIDTGLGFGVNPTFTRAAWTYGRPQLGPLGDPRIDFETQVWGGAISGRGYGGGGHPAFHYWWALAPLAWEPNREWSSDAELDPWPEMELSPHAFDIEATLYVGVVYVRAGFSPLEFFDFLAGWFGWDPWEDDIRFSR